MAEKEYQRLTWARLRRTGLLTAFATRSSLWLGKDHLLCIDSTGYAEEYKRFYFRDLQAVVARRSNRRMWWNIALVPLNLFPVCMLLFASPGLPLSGWDQGDVAVGILFLSLLLLFMALVLINTLKGPGCVFYVRTAVQTEVLPSLNRLRRARKVLDRIRPLIEEAQGRLSPEEIANNFGSPAALDAPPVIALHQTAATAPPPRHYSGKVHLVLFWLLLADVPLTAVSVLYDKTWMDLASALLMLVTVGYAIASLLKQHNTTLPASLRRLPWLVLGWAALMVVTAIAYAIVLAINNPDALNRSLSPLEDPVVLVMTVISTGGTAALGVAGLVLLRKFRASLPSSVPEPSTVSGQAAR